LKRWELFRADGYELGKCYNPLQGVIHPEEVFILSDGRDKWGRMCGFPLNLCRK